MKVKIFTLVIALFGAICTSTAQNNTIVNENSAWATLYSWLGPDSLVKSTGYHFFDGDTVFNEKTYKKVFKYWDEQHIERFFTGLIREENKKTYFIYPHPNNTIETLLYDFSLETGDTLFQVRAIIYENPFDSLDIGYFLDTAYYLVEKCDTIIFNGEPRKRMMLAIDYSYVDTVIETIGSLSGLLSPLCYDCTGFRELLCYTLNGELLYKNPKYSECYYNNLSTLPTIEQSIFSIFPNPATHTLFITSENEKISKIDIFDITGRNVYNKRFENYSSKYEITVSGLLTGLYFIQIKTEKGQTLSYKFLKN